jgi:hypothetical protein
MSPAWRVVAQLGSIVADVGERAIVTDWNDYDAALTFARATAGDCRLVELVDRGGRVVWSSGLGEFEEYVTVPLQAGTWWYSEHVGWH